MGGRDAGGHSISNPYRELSGHWLTGEIHAHVNVAGGRDTVYEDGVSPATIYSAARKARLDFVCMSVDVTELKGGAGHFGDVLSGLEHGVVGIPGREIQNNFYSRETSDEDYFPEPGADYLHVLTIGRRGISLCLHPRYYEILRPKSGGSWSHIKQALLHPEPGGHLDQLRVSGLEIYNGFTADRLRDKGKEHLYCDYDEYCWDEMLMEGRLYWGFAGNDAFFEKTDTFNSFSPLGTVYVSAQPGARAPEIVRALARGCFYSSAGIQLRDAPIAVSEEGSTVRIQVAARERVNWTAKVFERARRGWRLGSYCVSNAIEAEFTIASEWKYVRVSCENVRDPWRRAWLQPITSHRFSRSLPGRA